MDLPCPEMIDIVPKHSSHFRAAGQVRVRLCFPILPNARARLATALPSSRPMLGLGLRSLRSAASPNIFLCGPRCPSPFRSFIRNASLHAAARPVPAKLPLKVLQLVYLSNPGFRRASQLANLPPLHSVRQITQAEAEADANPSNVDAQVKLFRLLLESSRPAGRNVIVSRWERMCEFVGAHSSYCCIDINYSRRTRLRLSSSPTKLFSTIYWHYTIPVIAQA